MRNKIITYAENYLKNKEIRYETMLFDSGSLMIDIWVQNNFYVIQFDTEKIGLSQVTSETALFDIIPDRSFYTFDEFKLEFEKLFGRLV